MEVLEFLHTQLRLSCSALNTARSALSCVISIDNVPVGQHLLVCRFLKGAFERKPPSRKYYAIWDGRQMLNYEPIQFVVSDGTELKAILVAGLS